MPDRDETVNPVPSEARAVEPQGIDAFEYQAPTPEHVDRITDLRESCKSTYRALMANVPECAERTLAIRSIEEVSMWGNKAIVFDGRPYLRGGAR